MEHDRDIPSKCLELDVKCLEFVDDGARGGFWVDCLAAERDFFGGFGALALDGAEASGFSPWSKASMARSAWALRSTPRSL